MKAKPMLFVASVLVGLSFTQRASAELYVPQPVVEKVAPQAGPAPTKPWCWTVILQPCVCPDFMELVCSPERGGIFAKCDTIEGPSCDPEEPGIKCADIFPKGFCF